MKIYDVLYAMDTGDATPKARPFDNLLGMKLSDSDITTTTTGNPVSIITNKAQNAISTLLSFSPKQSGSGDPSPSNVCPIVGWTEANLFGCGKNLISISPATEKRKNGNPILIYGDNNSCTMDVNNVASYYVCWELSDRVPESWRNIRLTISTTITGGFCRFVWCDDWSGTLEDNASSTITIGDSIIGKKLGLRFFNNTGQPQTISKAQIELGSQSTDYVPFIAPTTTTIPLGGTYYGFTVDVERGVLRVTHGAKDMGSLTWRKTSGEGHFYCANLLDDFPYKLVETQKMVCSCYKFDGIGSQQRGYYGADGTFRYFYTVNPSILAREIYISDSARWATMTVEEFTQAVTGQYVAYELATPLELPLTPQTVALLSGANTLWTDGDSLSVTYKAKRG